MVAKKMAIHTTIAAVIGILYAYTADFSDGEGLTLQPAGYIIIALMYMTSNNLQYKYVPKGRAAYDNYNLTIKLIRIPYIVMVSVIITIYGGINPIFAAIFALLEIIAIIPSVKYKRATYRYSPISKNNSKLSSDSSIKSLNLELKIKLGIKVVIFLIALSFLIGSATFESGGSTVTDDTGSDYENSTSSWIMIIPYSIRIIRILYQVRVINKQNILITKTEAEYREHA